MNKIDKKVLQKIKKENIKPTSGWVFAIKWSLLKALIVLSLIFASLAFAVLLKIVMQGDFAFAQMLSGGYFIHFVQLAGLLWLGFLLLFMALLRYEVYKSKYGYRIEGYKVGALALLLTLLLGSLIYKTQMNSFAELVVSKVLPYTSFEKKLQAMWHNPQRGLYEGSLLQDYFEGMQEVDFIDIKGNIWTLDLSNLGIIDKIILKHSPSIVILTKEPSGKVLRVCAVKPAPQVKDALHFKKDMLKEIQERASKEQEERKGLFKAWLNSDETKRNFLRKSNCTQ